MKNVNLGHNTELLNSCTILKEYAIFVDKIRSNRKAGLSIEDAVDKAVGECISENVLSEFLIKNKSEVIGMCITEYDEQATLKQLSEESKEEGREEGRIETLKELVENGTITIEIAADMLGVSVEEFKKLVEGLKR